MISKESLLEVECYEDNDLNVKKFDATLLAISKDYAYVVQKDSNKVEKIYYDRLKTKF